jgi:Spy/CpxP family protein refolding chaperone
MKAKIVLMFVSAAVLLTAVTMAQQPMPPGAPSPAAAPSAPNPPAQMASPNVPGPAAPVAVPNAPNPPNPPLPPDPLADVMFPPEMVLGHARQLNLTDEQKAFVRNEVESTMTRFNELQWKLQDEMESLHETLKSNSVNEQQALAQLNNVLDIEREIKRLHVGLGIRIKNHLTPEQQEQLHRMRVPHFPTPPMQ